MTVAELVEACRDMQLVLYVLVPGDWRLRRPGVVFCAVASLPQPHRQAATPYFFICLYGVCFTALHMYEQSVTPWRHAVADG